MHEKNPIENWEKLTVAQRKVFLKQIGFDISNSSDASIKHMSKEGIVGLWTAIHSVREELARIKSRPKSVSNITHGTAKLIRDLNLPARRRKRKP